MVDELATIEDAGALGEIVDLEAKLQRQRQHLNSEAHAAIEAIARRYAASGNS